MLFVHILGMYNGCKNRGTGCEIMSLDNIRSYTHRDGQYDCPSMKLNKNINGHANVNG